MVLATLMSDAATALGLIAAAIAVGGFVMHAKPALDGRAEEDLRRLTVVGGIGGFAMAVLLVAVSMVW